MEKTLEQKLRDALDAAIKLGASISPWGTDVTKAGKLRKIENPRVCLVASVALGSKNDGPNSNTFHETVAKKLGISMADASMLENGFMDLKSYCEYGPEMWKLGYKLRREYCKQD